MAQGNRINHENSKIPKFKVLLILSMKEMGYSQNTIADTVQVSLPCVSKYSKMGKPSKEDIEDLKQQIEAFNHVVERGLKID